jgi:signal transduction histidine kinase
MNSILSDYYFTLDQVLVYLLLIDLIGIVVFWGVRRRWRNKLEEREQELAGLRREVEILRQEIEALGGVDVQILTDFVHTDVRGGLNYISDQSEKTLKGLGEEQLALREQQDQIINKSSELLQSVENCWHLYKGKPIRPPRKELRDIKGLVQHTLAEGLFLYAESRSVRLMVAMDDVRPISIYLDSMRRAIKNVIHNAIKYSFPSGIVEIILTLIEGEAGGKMIHITVKDTGKGIAEEDHERIFLPGKRASLTEGGSGLGLYLAREAAKRNDGDVILVRSSLNQGSTFRIILPYDND